jgi:hypothetical protein
MKAIFWLRLLAGASLLVACGDDDDGSEVNAGDGDVGDGGDACPNLAGTWTIKEHCGGAPLIGMTVTITQNGCDLVVSDMGDFAGTVDEGGAFSLEGMSITGDAVSCTGTATASMIEETCAGSCKVSFEK